MEAEVAGYQEALLSQGGVSADGDRPGEETRQGTTAAATWQEIQTLQVVEEIAHER